MDRAADPSAGVKLVAVTSSAEAVIARCARVSSPQNRNNPPEKLLAYCIKHGHWSVFEMANMVVEIATSRAVSAQILRHRSFSFQEFSQRYAEVPQIFRHRARRQDPTNRQHSTDDLPEDVQRWWEEAQSEAFVRAGALYREALKRGIAKESARFLLPMASRTVVCMNGTVRSWIHYLQLRTAEGVQIEHREVALACQDIFVREFPVTSRALGWGAQDSARP